MATEHLARRSIIPPAQAAGIIAVDFNRDGFLDFAFPIQGNTISVMMANGSGGFKPIANYEVVAGPQGIAKATLIGTVSSTLFPPVRGQGSRVLLGNGDELSHGHQFQRTLSRIR